MRPPVRSSCRRLVSGHRGEGGGPVPQIDAAAAGRLRVHLRFDRHARPARQDLGPALGLRARGVATPRSTGACAIVGHGAAAAHVRLRVERARRPHQRPRAVRRAPVLPGRHRRGARRAYRGRGCWSRRRCTCARSLAAGIACRRSTSSSRATAPLAQQLAAEVEQRFATRLVEIYGSTETGEIATRRPTQDPHWQLWPGVTLSQAVRTPGRRAATSRSRRACRDVLELPGPTVSCCTGALADLVNIAGKRSSLAYLNHQLNSIPGVVDGAFFHSTRRAARRPAWRGWRAAWSLRTSMPPRVLAALRDRVDAVFLPRPLLFVARLPRKPRASCHRRRCARWPPLSAARPPWRDPWQPSRPSSSPAEHPALQGHFPGTPIVPGVLLLDEALRAAASTQRAADYWRIGTPSSSSRSPRRDLSSSISRCRTARSASACSAPGSPWRAACSCR